MPPKAPRPGVGKRKERTSAARQKLIFRLRDETRSCAIGNLSIEERGVIRKATGGLPIEAYMGETVFGVDSLMVLWWVCRRAEGEAFLTLKKVEEEWPDDLEEDDIEVTLDDGEEDDDSPET